MNITKSRSWFRYWITGYAIPTEGLALFRIAFAGYILLFKVPTYGWIADAPQAFFEPPFFSVGILFDSFPPSLVLHGLSIAAIALYVALLVGYRTRATCILLAIVLVLGNTFAFSFGKINHSFIVDFLPLVLAFSPWGEAYSLDAQRRRGQLGAERHSSLDLSNAWPVALMALLIGFGYFSAGFVKAPVWFDLDTATHGTRSWLIRGFFQTGRVEYFADFFLRLDSRFFWEALDVLAVTFELGFLFAVVHVRAFRVFLVVAVGFHLANYLMLNISFASLYIVYLLFVPSHLILSRLDMVRLERVVGWFMRPRFALILLVLCLTSYALYVTASVWPGSMIFSPLAILFDPLGLDLMAIFVWGTYMCGVAGTLSILYLVIRDGSRRHVITVGRHNT